MSKLLNSVLDRVSENNNEYRKELQNLYKKEIFINIKYEKIITVT